MSEASWAIVSDLIKYAIAAYFAYKVRSVLTTQAATAAKVEEVKDVAKTAAEHAEEVKQVLAVATQTSDAKMADLKSAGEVRDEKMGAIVAGQEAAAATADKILIHVNDKYGKLLGLCGELAQFRAEDTKDPEDIKRVAGLKSDLANHMSGQAEVDAKYPPKTV